MPAAAEAAPAGERLRTQRLALELGVREVARRAKVDAAHLSRVERGLAEPSPEMLTKVGGVLDLSARDVLPLAGKLPHRIEIELAGARLVDGVVDGERLDAWARASLRRNALRHRADEIRPSDVLRFDPVAELKRHGYEVHEDGEPGERGVRFDGTTIYYRASGPIDMRFVLSHALGHVALDESPTCSFGTSNNAELDATALGAILLVPRQTLHDALQKAGENKDWSAEIGAIIDLAARALGAPPWVVAERASEERLMSGLADIAEW